jgi:uncharacterized membrane protein
MIALVSAAVSLLGSHFRIASSRLRDVLVRRLGGHGDLGLYSLVTLVAFAVLVAAYGRAPLDVVWMARDALKLALAPIMVPAFVLAVVGLTTPNPTIVGAERLFDRLDCVRGILRVTRSPFPAGSGLWALAHVIAAGDIAGILTFGSVAVLGLAGTVVLDEKGRTYPLEWVSLRASVPTSRSPPLSTAVSASRLARSDGGDSCSPLCSSAPRSPGIGGPSV